MISGHRSMSMLQRYTHLEAEGAFSEIKLILSWWAQNVLLLDKVLSGWRGLGKVQSCPDKKLFNRPPLDAFTAT